MSVLESEKTEVVSQSSIESVDVNENNIGKSDKAKVDSTPKKQKVKGVPVLRKPRYLWRPEHEYVLRSALQSFKFLPKTTTYKVVVIGSNILVA